MVADGSLSLVGGERCQATFRSKRRVIAERSTVSSVISEPSLDCG